MSPSSLLIFFLLQSCAFVWAHYHHPSLLDNVIHVVYQPGSYQQKTSHPSGSRDRPGANYGSSQTNHTIKTNSSSVPDFSKFRIVGKDIKFSTQFKIPRPVVDLSNIQDEE